MQREQYAKRQADNQQLQFENNATAALKAFEGNKYTDAAALYRKIIEMQRATSEHYYYLAESERLSSNYEKAIEAYSQAHINAPNALVLSIEEGVALTFIEKGELEKAISTLENLLTRDASRWRTTNALGVAYALRGDTKAAIEYFNLSETLHPSSASTLNNAGLALLIAGDTNNSIAQFLKALQHMSPSSQYYTKILNNLAMAYVFKGDNSKAEMLLLDRLSAAETYNNLGYFALLKDNTTLARSYLAKALNKSPVFYERANDNLQSLEEK